MSNLIEVHRVEAVCTSAEINLGLKFTVDLSDKIEGQWDLLERWRVPVDGLEERVRLGLGVVVLRAQAMVRVPGEESFDERHPILADLGDLIPPRGPSNMRCMCSARTFPRRSTCGGRRQLLRALRPLALRTLSGKGDRAGSRRRRGKGRGGQEEEPYTCTKPRRTPCSSARACSESGTRVTSIVMEV